ncbi:MAG: cation transporter [Chloroflexota bacterium]|nr:MAG: cation transporter [Chloroflexota bacterium]
MATIPSIEDHDGERHAHAHGHGGEHHHHDARDGELLGWFRHTFVHSHDVSNKVDGAVESNERGISALKISLVGLGLTALFQVVIVWFSGSTALLADTIHNFGDAATSIPLWIAFALVRRGQSRRFTYGYGRTEDLAGIAIVGLIFFSACVAGYESVRKILHPEPITHLGWVAAAAVIGFLGNEVVAIFRIRVGREIGSAALIADGYHSRVDGFTSLAVLGGAIGVWLGVPILDPIVGLLISVTILFIVKDAASTVFRRVLDGIEPEILAEVEHAPTHVEGVRDVHGVRARWLGHKVHADLHISVDPQLSVLESHRIAESVLHVLADHVRSFGGATVHVCPSERSRV